MDPWRSRIVQVAVTGWCPGLNDQGIDVDLRPVLIASTLGLPPEGIQLPPEVTLLQPCDASVKHTVIST